MFVSVPNIGSIVEGSDGCGGSAANIPFAIIIISPTETTTLPHGCTFFTICTFCILYTFCTIARFAHLENPLPSAASSPVHAGRLYCNTQKHYMVIKKTNKTDNTDKKDKTDKKLKQIE